MTTSTTTDRHPFKHAPVCVPVCVPSVSRSGSPGTASVCVRESPRVPPFTGDSGTHSTSPGESVSPVRVPGHTDTGRSTWLLTPRCRPAWTAILTELDDGQWHPLDHIRQIMRDTADLADPTIEHHLREAGLRRWTERRRGRLRLRDRAAFETGLDATEPTP